MEHKGTQMWAGPVLGSWDCVALKWPLGIYGVVRAPTELPWARGSWDRCRLTPTCPDDLRQEEDGGGGGGGLAWPLFMVNSFGLQGQHAEFAGPSLHARLCPGHRALGGTVPHQP